MGFCLKKTCLISKGDKGRVEMRVMRSKLREESIERDGKRYLAVT